MQELREKTQAFAIVQKERFWIRPVEARSSRIVIKTQTSTSQLQPTEGTEDQIR